MDRLEAMRVFVAALDQGSLAAAGRRLQRSPAAVTRAIAALEAHVGVKLLHRTTRAITLTEAGERYAASCRRVLTDLDEADMQAAGERSAPRGVLTVTAPLIAGARIVRPILDAFLDEHSAVQARLLLLDRVVNLVDEGVDAALRIAHLPDSSQIAVKVGAVRWVVCASPDYLVAIETDQRTRRPRGSQHDRAGPGAARRCVDVPRQRRRRESASGSRRFAAFGQHHRCRARLGGRWTRRYASVCRIRFSRSCATDGSDRLLQDFEPPPLPVHIVVPDGRLTVAKVRAFVDFAVPKLKTAFAASG